MNILICIVITNFACTQQAITTGFDPSKLILPGDNVHYGSYFIYKIGNEICTINDPGDPEAILGGLMGTGIYLICGKGKALMIDPGNNYIDGFEKDLIKPRKNAGKEFLDIVNKLIGNRSLEVAVSHMHQYHSGKTKAFLNTWVNLWIGEGEDMERLKPCMA